MIFISVSIIHLSYHRVLIVSAFTNTNLVIYIYILHFFLAKCNTLTSKSAIIFLSITWTNKCYIWWDANELSLFLSTKNMLYKGNYMDHGCIYSKVNFTKVFSLICCIFWYVLVKWNASEVLWSVRFLYFWIKTELKHNEVLLHHY